ncbi:MAG: MBL fold metallo-hydrolase [Anaerolineae bacterium]
MAGIRERIHTLAIPTPFPVGPVNVYLIEGDPLTLVDTGPLTKAARDALVGSLSELGYTLSDIEQVIVTHSHRDHVGQLQRVVGASDAPVLSHHRNLHWLVDFEVEWVRRLGFYTMYLYQAGLPEEKVSAMRDLMSHGIHLGASIQEERLQALHDGDEIRAGGVEWQVFHMPGHASGHLVMYQPEAGLIIAGDLLLATISSNPVLESPARGNSTRPRSLVEYLKSLRRLAELEASETLTGHGPPVADHRGLVNERIAMHGRRLDRIANFLVDGRRDPDPAPSVASSQSQRGTHREVEWRTPYQVCQSLFPELAEFEAFLGMSEAIAHLDVLEDEDRAVAEKRGGFFYYRARSETGDRRLETGD